MKPEEKRLIKVEMPFVEELAGLGLVILYDFATIITFKTKMFRNRALLTYKIISVSGLNIIKNIFIKIRPDTL